MTTSPATLPDLDACAREPIHIPGAIQPHGVLLALEEPTLRIVQASANAPEILDTGGENLLGRSFPDLLSNEQRARLETALAANDLAALSPLPIPLPSGKFDALFHRSDGLLLVEFERAAPETENFAQHHRRLQAAITAMHAARTPADLYSTIARAVAEITGFERVMVYQFDAAWHGKVVGEVLTADVDSYFDLHFPASDIPEQARALYAKSWLRIIPNADYTAVPLDPPLNPRTGRPLDLSFAVLRSVSPVHLEYLRNMNVRASMSVSLLVDGRLWGLIACHHRTPRGLPYAIRAACELFGQIASAAIAAHEQSQRLTERAEATAIQTRFFDIIAAQEKVDDALLQYTPELLQFLRASGAAVCLGEKVHLVGETPGLTAIASLLTWLQALPPDQPVFATDHLSAHFAAALPWKEAASGLLAVRLSRVESHWVLWFRPEVLTTVTWAGNPDKPVEPGLRLHPRKSFAAWQQTVTGHSLPWTEAEIQGAHELRQALGALVIRRTERLLKLNAELERKNTDLNSFAYIASHDLKEPLRNIGNYARFIREDHASTLDPDINRRVDAIAEMAGHTTDLLEALARYSALGRMDLKLEEVALDPLLTSVLTSLESALREANVEIRRPTPLPAATCDPVLVREVFANLIVNAVRYNDKPSKWVEISVRPSPDDPARGPVFVVSDNGIGIRERNFEAVFRMFRRLNEEGFGSGTGAGLAIVKSIVDRHGGRIWLESDFGHGTSFLFTLR